jgi:transcription elongation factor Elf1
MPIHHLHEPIDVFSEWLDDCEAAERGEVAAAAPSGSNSRSRGNMSKVVHDTSQDYSDDDSEGLPEASGFSTTAAAAATTSGQKRSAAENEGSDNEEEGGGKKQKATTATLGLDESDDDSD